MLWDGKTLGALLQTQRSSPGSDQSGLTAATKERRGLLTEWVIMNGSSGGTLLIIPAEEHDSEAQTYMLPLVQVRQVDFAVGVNVLPGFDHHGAGGLDEANGGVVGIGVQQPQTHRDVIGISYRRHRPEHAEHPDPSESATQTRRRFTDRQQALTVC